MADTAVKTANKKSALSFGKKEKKLLSDPLNDNNPITVQVLGICSALAVTTLVKQAVVMSIAVVFVCALSNLAISLLRRYVPKQVRMIVQLVVIAFLVTIVELTLKALDFEVYKQLSVFIGLIITNCIIMGRLEAFAMANDPWRSLLDGIGNGLGYGAILIIVAVLREVFGKGQLFGWKLIGSEDALISTTGILGGYLNNNLMVLSASAMFIIAILIWVHRSYNSKLVDVS